MDTKETFLIDLDKLCALCKANKTLIQRDFYNHQSFSEPPPIFPNKFYVTIANDTLSYYATRQQMIEGKHWLQMSGFDSNYRVVTGLFRVYHSLMLKTNVIVHIEEKENPTLGETTMDGAVVKGDIDKVKLLQAVDVKLTNSLMNLAARFGKFEMMLYLFDQGIPCSKTTADSATINGYLEIVEWLYIQGIVCYEDTPRRAAESGYDNIIKYLREKGMKCE